MAGKLHQSERDHLPRFFQGVAEPATLIDNNFSFTRELPTHNEVVGVVGRVIVDDPDFKHGPYASPVAL